MTGSTKLVAGFRPSRPPAWAIAWLVAAVALAALIAVWRGDGYWDYSDGVYALSARQILAGDVPYRDFAAAQPPLLFAFGAAILAFGDGVGWLRVAMAGVQLVGAALAVVAVLRLTGRRVPAALAGLGALVTPWALHEHAQLTPETFAAPLLLAAALVLARGRIIWLGAVLAGAAALCKLAFGLPALALLLASPARWRALAWGIVVGLIALAVSLGLFGSEVVDGVLTAQLQSGRQTLDAVAGLWVQAGWNLLVLLVPATFAFTRRDRAADPALLRLLAAGAGASLLLLLSLSKEGSYLNVLVVMELPLLVLAVAGATWVLAPGGSRAGDANSAGASEPDPTTASTAGPISSPAGAAATARRSGGPDRFAVAALGAAGLLWLVQVGGLVGSPDDPKGFTRPFSATAHGRLLSPDAVDRAVAVARACPAGQPYAGAPAIAFRAERRLAGDQPDPFISRSPVNARFAQRAVADLPRCEVAP